ncbi:T9SS type A sorting domain-containing protein [Elizabethkingia anophelis]|nr:T9SS type A sorting domain-containing protein [Elizabethkingia anophelis]
MLKDLQILCKKASGVALLLIAVSAYSQQWQDVGGSGTVSASDGAFNNLAIDNSGNYYLSYYDMAVSKGNVQKFNGNSWSYLGSNSGITNDIATYNSLTVDKIGNVFYTNQLGYPDSGMEVRQFSGNSWSQLSLPTTSSLNYHASAISNNNVLFTFAGHNSGTVQRYTNGNWENVGNSGFSGSPMYAEMVIGTNNKIYTCSVSGGQVKVFENSVTAGSSDNWTLTGGNFVGAGSGSEQYNSDIAIDGSNNLYVAYVSNSSNGQKLNVKKFNGTVWEQIGPANFSSGRVQHIAIAVSASGQPFVVASRFEDDNFLRNTVYMFDSTNQQWTPIGGDYLSAGEAKYNDLIVDNINNYLVLAYSDGPTMVKRISLSTLSVKDTNIKKAVGFYPNPTKGILHFRGENSIKNIGITNVLGQSQSFRLSKNQIDITHLNAGVYFVAIQLNSGQTLFEKVIKN